ncbi:hypothetical protein AURDEDRAFT_39961, partial [Auricularia subglabra TFB-10046 SS5]
IEQGKPIPFALPAFPCKSPNTVDKVLGVLPDKAEEVSLLFLQGLCNNIKQVYSPGAELTIVSDGIVYNDLFEVADTTVWTYGERLRKMATELGCTSIRFARLSAMLDGPLPAEAMDYHDAETYAGAAPIVRETLLKTYAEPGYDVSAHIARDEAVNATYRGYLRYVPGDLHVPAQQDLSDRDDAKKAFKRRVSKVAKQMISRGKCYAACVKAAFPDAIRLSIHAGNSATKLPIAVLPHTGDRAITPWHSVMTCRLDGSLVPMSHKEAAARDDLELVRAAGGQAWCYREKSPLYDALTAAGATIEHLHPCGVRIEFPHGTPFTTLDIRAVRALSDWNSPVLVRGLEGGTDLEAFLAKGREMGPIMKWTFGELLEVKEVPADSPGFNSSLSSEAMPFHYDGVFKVVDGVSTPPHYQMFVAVTPSAPGIGHTLFASSPRLFEHVRLSMDELRAHTWRGETVSFANAKLGGLPLVVPHPATGAPCFRYHEDWSRARTRFQEILVRIEGVDEKTDAAMRAEIDRVLYDWRVCLRLSWQRGDVLVNDNILTLHTREEYVSKVGRELWRLHID